MRSSALFPLSRVLTVLACVLLAGCEYAQAPLRVSDPAPAYGALSLDGDSVHLAQFLGRPVAVNVWATWCVPCRQEMPELQALFERYEGALEVIGVSIDDRGTEELVHDFIEEVGVHFRILWDSDGAAVARFTTVGVPETFLIDRRVIRARWTGKFQPLAPENLARVDEVVERDSA